MFPVEAVPRRLRFLPTLLVAMAVLLPAGVSSRSAVVAEASPRLAREDPGTVLLPRAPVDPAAGALLSGTVTNLATGSPLSEVLVAAGGAATLTDARGYFELRVPPGRYDARFEASGFGGATMVGVLVAPGDTRVDVGLAPVAPSAPEAAAVAARLTARGDREAAPAAAVAPEALAAPVLEVPRIIRVLMPDGQIVAMDVDEYLKGVVPAEMGYVFRRSLEALKAQAIASRTYAASGCLADSAGDPTRCEPGLDANVDTTTRTQVWRPVHYDVTDEAVLSTHGQVARDGEALIRALFFARTPLRTLNSEDSPCCGGYATRYLRSVSSPDAFRERWGHGAGMSQEGAAVLAAWGATAEEIIAHYYSGVRVGLPGRPRLYDAGVSPRLGNIFEPFTFAVGYADPDGDPPTTHAVLIDGQARAMTGPSRPEHDYRQGATYTYTTTLPLGTHPVSFLFEDGYTEPVALAAGEVVVAPLPLRLPDAVSEAVPPPATGTWSGQLTFAPGEMTPLALAPPGEGTADSAPEPDPLVAWTSRPLAANFPFMAVAAELAGPSVAEDSLGFELRTSRDGTVWSEWTALAPDESHGKAPSPAGEQWTQLLVARGRFLQVRLVAAGTGADALPVEGITVHYFNSDAGPSAPPAAARQADPPIVSRAAWGADERLRFDANGEVIWPVAYTRPLAQLVHHTVTTNDPADPAAVVRSVYYYHAVTRAWGDIGYNYLVDHRGNIYEGRFGGERDGRVAQGGHALQYNANTLGIAFLGTFSAAQPSAAARAVMVSLLASKGLSFDLWPLDPVTLQGNRFPRRVLGHRDVLPGHTECPGNAFYPTLDSLRQAVDARMRELSGSPPTATSTRPAATATSTRPAATATSTLPPTATPLPPPSPPPGCLNPVTGGDFEADDDRWQRNRAAYTAYDAYRGSRAMFVGLRNDEPDNGQSYASVLQSVALPPRVGQAILRFALKTRGYEGDRHLVRILDANGAILALGGLPVPLQSEWTVYDLDITGAVAGQAGQSVRLYFAAVNNGDGQRSYLRLDDVSLLVCPPLAPGSPSATPSRSATQPSPATGTAVSTPAPNPTNPPPATATRAASHTPLATGTPLATATPQGTTILLATATALATDASTATATAVVTAGATATATATPAVGCVNLLPEGSFEAPDLSGWVVSGNQPAQRVSAPVAAGRGALALGLTVPGQDSFGYAAVARAVAGPAEAGTATLSLALQPLAVGPGDAFVVELRRTTDGLRRVVLGPTIADPAGRWTSHAVSLDPGILGPDLQVFLAVLNRAQAGGPGAVTAVAVDDLRLDVCSSPRMVPWSYFPLARRQWP